MKHKVNPVDGFWAMLSVMLMGNYAGSHGNSGISFLTLAAFMVIAFGLTVGFNLAFDKIETTLAKRYKP